MLEPISEGWFKDTVVVCAPGPSFTEKTAKLVDCYRSRVRTLAVTSAYRRLPNADLLFATDAKWWDTYYAEQPDFRGQRWSSHEDSIYNDKKATALRWGLKLVRGRQGSIFSTAFASHPDWVAYGDNSGFAAVNLALLMGASDILLVGFDMRVVEDKGHFFGEYDDTKLVNTRTHGYERFIGAFKVAAHNMPRDVTITNCTPDSALTCFPYADLQKTLEQL